ncbi:MAG: hypothetical protein V7K18_09565 [Nostoc sp.]
MTSEIIVGWALQCPPYNDELFAVVYAIENRCFNWIVRLLRCTTGV